MTDVSIRDRRNKGGEIVDRAAAGEPITITRDDRAVAELVPVRPRFSTAQVIERWRHLPPSLAAPIAAGKPAVLGDQLLYVGTDDRGIELEIVAVLDDSGRAELTVIHAIAYRV